MSGFLRIIAATAVGVTLCIAARPTQDSQETQEDASNRVLGVTQSGHFIGAHGSHKDAVIHSGASSNNTDVVKSFGAKQKRRQQSSRHPPAAFSLGQLAVDTSVIATAEANVQSADKAASRFISKRARRKRAHRNRAKKDRLGRLFLTSEGLLAPGKPTKIAPERHAKDDEEEGHDDEEEEQGMKPERQKPEGHDDEEEDDEKEREKALQDAKEITDTDRFLLEFGWLVGVFAIAGGCYLIYKAWPYRHLGKEQTLDFLRDTAEPANAGGLWTQTLYELFWGVHAYAYMVNSIIIFFSLGNFVFFALETEVRFNKVHEREETQILYFGARLETWVPHYKIIFEQVTVVILGSFIVLRALASLAHPKWDLYGNAAPFAFLIADPFTHVEIIALLPTIIDTLTGKDKLLNICWLSLVRTMEMMSRQGSIGAALRQWESLKEEKPIIRMVFSYGCFVLVLLSGFYYVANAHNPASEWEAVRHSNETGDGPKFWQRFTSIPSSMFFVLINLSCEYPLADSYQTGLQRGFAMLACVIGVPLFAIPTGIIGNALQDHTTREIDRRRGNIPRTEEHTLPVVQLNDNDLPVREASQAGLTLAERDAEQEDGRETDVEMKGYSTKGAVWLLSFGSVVVYFFYTACLIAPDRKLSYFGVTISVMEGTVAHVDGLVGFMFLLHFGIEAQSSVNLLLETSVTFWYANETYILSWRCLIDIFSSFPGLIHCAMALFGSGEYPVTLDFMRALCVVRLFKGERYIGAFQKMFEILKAHKPLLQATGYVSFMMLIFFSVVLYFTERDSPDEEIREYYGSAARAIWAELINLHGEWVLCDFSAPGKAVCTYIDLIAIGICMVPIVIFTDGFADRLKQDERRQNSLTMKPWQYFCQPEEDGKIRYLYDLFYAHLHPHMAGLKPTKFHIMRAVSVSSTVLTCIVTVALTMKCFDRRIQNTAAEFRIQDMFLGIDVMCVAWFSFECLLRCVATKGMHLISIGGVCDLLSLFALFQTTCMSRDMRDTGLHPEFDNHDTHDDMYVPMRLLRCFCLESYTHALHTIFNVVYIKRRALAASFYCLVCVWWTFATCLYLSERQWPGNAAVKDNPHFVGKPAQDHEEESDEITMEHRYGDVLTALQYALVHITGDYPIADYKLRSMPLHFVFVALGMCCVSSFTGIFTAGFRSYMEDTHAVERHNAAKKRLALLSNCIIAVQYRFRRMRKLRLAAIAAGENFIRPGPDHPLQTIHDLMLRKNHHGRSLCLFFNAVLILNLLNTLASTVNEIEWSCAQLLEAIELLCGFFFVVEYVLRLLAASPPFSNFFQPFRIIDLLCILPSLMYMANGGQGRRAAERHKIVGLHQHSWSNSEEMEAFIDCLMMMRAVRIFDIPSIKREARQTGKAISAISHSLFMPTVLALNVWVFTASIFHWSENYFKGPEQENMSSVPSALYWTSIFIIGEWANVDFSPGAGSRLCIFYCLVGVCIFAIPVGIVADAVQDSLMEVIETRAELKRLFGASKGKSLGGLRGGAGLDNEEVMMMQFSEISEPMDTGEVEPGDTFAAHYIPPQTGSSDQRQDARDKQQDPQIRASTGGSYQQQESFFSASSQQINTPVVEAAPAPVQVQGYRRLQAAGFSTDSAGGMPQPPA